MMTDTLKCLSGGGLILFFLSSSLSFADQSLCTNGPFSPQLDRSWIKSAVTRVTAAYAQEVKAANLGALKFKISFEPDQYVSGYYGGMPILLSGSKTGGYLSEDGYLALVCHELGHAIGGYPSVIFSQNQQELPYPLKSAEGQADYFSASRCLRKIFRKDAPNSQMTISRMRVSTRVQHECDLSFLGSSNPFEESAICQRISMAGLSLSSFVAWSFCDRGYSPNQYPVARLPDFDKTDPLIVQKTKTDWPESQCRFDTFFSGAICNENQGLRFDLDDKLGGECIGSGGIGKRPACWFAGSNNI